MQMVMVPAFNHLFPKSAKEAMWNEETRLFSFAVSRIQCCCGKVITMACALMAGSGGSLLSWRSTYFAIVRNGIDAVEGLSTAVV